MPDEAPDDHPLQQVNHLPTVHEAQLHLILRGSGSDVARLAPPFTPFFAKALLSDV